MPAGLPVAIALLVQLAGAPPATAAPADPLPSARATAYGPALPAPPKPTPKVAATPPDACSTARPSADANEIVVCAERPQGYRLHPDVMEAKRLLRSRPKRRSMEHMKDTGCAVVGPMGCINGGGINLIGAALTAVQMASKLARGENIGQMFVTTPEPTEYELYREAKRIREAEEAAKAAAAKAKAAVAGGSPAPRR